MRLSMLPRSMHCWYAKAFGYFWLPCSLCGRYTGGHEWKDRDGKSSVIAHPDRPGILRGICAACTRAGYGDDRREVLG